MFQFIFLINCRVTAETKINCCTVAEYIKKKVNCIKSKSPSSKQDFFKLKQLKQEWQCQIYVNN